MRFNDVIRVRGAARGCGSALLLTAVISFCLPDIADARFFRPGQIPNGGENGCLNCHMSPSGGDARNAFGLTIQGDFLTSVDADGAVLWGPDLAAIDSDDDGFTNGEELGDPDGTWEAGDDLPGDPADVTLPGDPDSHPPEPPPEPTSISGSTWANIKALVGKLVSR